jgi:hypothetical protein
MLARACVFGLVALFAVPASAAQFFIVQDIEKQSCTVAQEPPKGDQHTTLGDGAYGDEATATAEMKRMLGCNPRDTSSGANPVAPAKQ